MTLPPDLVTGNAQIDHDHLTLMEAVEALQGGPNPEYAMLLLEQYFGDHFRSEEALAEATAYPEELALAREHRQFFDVWVNLKAKWRRNPSVDALIELKMALGIWVEGHVQRQDKRLADWVKEHL